jgi:predicted house-cleaning noncanonical NTP pyrophosphatase (MazG superfamily)
MCNLFGTPEAAKKSEHEKAMLVLQPEAELYRNDEFLKAVVDTASELASPVLITGSVLGHAFYTLQREGISVRTQAPSYSRVRQKQTFRKLVRDDIPSRILGHGERVDQARIDKAESRAALVVKLFEESQELLNASSPDEVTAELADLTEVLRSLCTATGVDWEAVQIAAEEKRRARGSFEHNVVLMETSWPRWKDQTSSSEAKVIPLSALGLVTSKEKDHSVNFAAAAAKGADNLVTLSNGTQLVVSITKDGIRIVERDGTSASDGQLKLPF